MFVLIGNMVGMIPYSFTFTSHIIVTFALATVVFIGVTILAFAKHGFHFFSFFVIPGLPWYMLPLLIPIEVISYLSRPISLSVRLFANMLAGHTLIKVFAMFVITMPFYSRCFTPGIHRCINWFRNINRIFAGICICYLNLLIHK